MFFKFLRTGTVKPSIATDENPMRFFVDKTCGNNVRQIPAPLKVWDEGYQPPPSPTLAEMRAEKKAAKKRRREHRHAVLKGVYQSALFERWASQECGGCLDGITDHDCAITIDTPSFKELLGFSPKDVECIASARYYEPLTVILLKDGTVIDESGRKRTDLEILDEY